MNLKVDVLKTIEDEIIKNSLWDIYESEFLYDRDKYPHNQMNYTKEDFFRALEDKTITKFILFDNKVPIGITIIIGQQHPDHSPWTNFNAFFKIGKEKKFYYVNVMVVNRKYQKLNIAGPTMINKIIQWISNEGGDLLGLDVPNTKKHVIMLIQHYCKKYGLNFKLIGSQNYYLISKEQKSTSFLNFFLKIFNK